MSTQFTTPTVSTAPPLFEEPKPEPITRVSIICSKGSLDMAYPGLILANAARMSGIEATLFFTFWGLDIVTKSKVDGLHVSTVGNPSMPMPTMLELLQDLSDSGAHLYACKMAMDMFKLTKEDLVPQVEDVISAMEFFDKSAGAPA